MHRKAIKNEKLVCISVYILMLCGVSIPNAGFLSSLHSVFSVLPGVEKVISLANFNLAQTRYSYITIAMITVICNHIPYQVTFPIFTSAARWPMG